jgi:hypothetical protein
VGAQIVGHWKDKVANRIYIFATGMFHGMTVDGLNGWISATRPDGRTLGCRPGGGPGLAVGRGGP